MYDTKKKFLVVEPKLEWEDKKKIKVVQPLKKTFFCERKSAKKGNFSGLTTNRKIEG